ncbi:unnamed protein product [Anisakis simplex]|uniref:adenosine deaminase n=1 Tax=Anisakis simplex TaxID=6269 RepID=A0A3P6N989_ANISI|nr:unnamed protein product [Anisakis simplex]
MKALIHIPETLLLSEMTHEVCEILPVPIVTKEIAEDLNFPKVELHLHLDGAARHETLLDLSLEKGISLKGAKTVEEVRRVVTVHKPSNLADMLTPFDIFLPVMVGDKDAIERVAYELCEDQSKVGVIYFEARYSPHLLSNTVDNLTAKSPAGAFKGKGPLEPRGVIEAVKRGFDRGETAFGVKARSILCCICGYPDWNNEVLELAKSSSLLGVVGIDVAGCSQGADEQYEPNILGVFQTAAKLGIHRTMHAGESGGVKEVVKAIDEMKAERIGHGYRLVLDEGEYRKYAIEKRIHLETCPYSSVMTGSVKLDWKNHPIARFAADDINFSINTDDTTCFENTLLTEYELARKEIGLTKRQLWKCVSTFRQCHSLNDSSTDIIYAHL